MRGACPLRWGEFERGIPLSCCRPGKALFIPYNSVLYKKERPHRPGTNPGGRSGANRPGFSRFAFCIRSSYTVGAPAAISRRNAPRVIKSARAGNAVDVRRRRCAPLPLLACAPFDGRITDTGQYRPRHRSGDMHKTGSGTGHMAGGRPGCALPALYECRLLSLDAGVQVSRPATRAWAVCSRLDCKVLQELKDQKDRAAGLLCLLMSPARAEIAMAACAATPGVVYVPAPTALPVASIAQLRRPYPAPQG